jgi:protein-tyrosine phosphatase
MAEVMLRHRLADYPDITVSSAGTGALVGQPMTPEAQAILSGLGLKDEPPHVARALTTGLVRSAALILALTREHRRKVVQFDPTATRRTFTLREFGFVAGQVGTDDLVTAHSQLVWRRRAEGLDPNDIHPLEIAVAAVFQANGVFTIPNARELDVADPYGQPLEAYAEAAVRMLPAIEATGDFFDALAKDQPKG